jgi:predicted secreted hydrolase
MRWVGALIILLCLLLLAHLMSAPARKPVERKADLATALGANGAGYAQADRPRDFAFPADHGPHPEFRHEWWYFTGNLVSERGRRFGYELTIFRIALSAVPRRRESAWATHQVYMGHLALADPKTGRFRFYERLSRGALGLAGARAAPFRVWLEDWGVSATQAGFPWRLKAAAGNIRLDLELTPAKPLVLQGEQGLDRKSAQGDASYYYSYTRLDTAGSVRVDGQVFDVQGLSWLDREWSSGGLGRGQEGWDWFALQLDDGADLMFYRLRRDDGSTDIHSGGIWVAPTGGSTMLAHHDLGVRILRRWKSSHGGTYPAQWRLVWPRRNCRLTVTPVLADQELNVSVRYWEGAVDVLGECAGKETKGWGYVELTGYGRSDTR